jgi:hypothetical protein
MSFNNAFTKEQGRKMKNNNRKQMSNLIRIKKKKKKKIEWTEPEGEGGKNAQKLLLEVVDNQILDNDPPETGLTLQRLLKEGFTKDEEKKLLAAVVAKEIFGVLKDKEAYNQKRYISALNSLPGPDLKWK